MLIRTRTKQLESPDKNLADKIRKSFRSKSKNKY